MHSNNRLDHAAYQTGLEGTARQANRANKQKKAAQRHAPSATSGASPEAGTAAGAAVPGATEEGGAFLAGAT